MTNLAFIFQGGMGGLLGGLMPFLLIFGVFYFLIIVPQRKRQKAERDPNPHRRKWRRCARRGSPGRDTFPACCS